MGRRRQEQSDAAGRCMERRRRACAVVASLVAGRSLRSAHVCQNCGPPQQEASARRPPREVDCATAERVLPIPGFVTTARGRAEGFAASRSASCSPPPGGGCYLHALRAIFHSVHNRGFGPPTSARSTDMQQSLLGATACKVLATSGTRIAALRPPIFNPPPSDQPPRKPKSRAPFGARLFQTTGSVYCAC